MGYLLKLTFSNPSAISMARNRTNTAVYLQRLESVPRLRGGERGRPATKYTPIWGSKRSSPQSFDATSKKTTHQALQKQRVGYIPTLQDTMAGMVDNLGNVKRSPNNTRKTRPN